MVMKNPVVSTMFLIMAVSMFLFLACGKDPQNLDLLTAIDREQSDVVQRLLDSGTDPNEVPVPAGIELEGAYPLHLTVVKGNKEIAQILLENGAKIDLKARNKDEAPPLSWAAFFGQKDMVLLLIKSGAAMNVVDANRATPLDAADFAWELSRADKEKARIHMDIITILKSNGGKSARDL